MVFFHITKSNKCCIIIHNNEITTMFNKRVKVLTILLKGKLFLTQPFFSFTTMMFVVAINSTICIH